MGKIVISGPQNISLDGVVQDPTGDEGFKLGGWFVQFGGTDLQEWSKVALDDALRAEAWLLGRRSYEYFGVRWRPRSGELADRLNSMPKYVVSSILEEPDWNNSTILKGDVVTAVSKLKQELDGEIVVPASYQLGRTLIEHDLADELRLVIFPVVLGGGERLFGETSCAKPMRLVDARIVGDSLAFLTYQFARDASQPRRPKITRVPEYPGHEPDPAGLDMHARLVESGRRPTRSLLTNTNTLIQSPGAVSSYLVSGNGIPSHRS